MMRAAPPPMLARRLLRWLLGHEEHAALVGDIDERYARLRVQRGGLAADAYYWRETLAAIRTYSTHTRTPGAYPREDSTMRHWLTDLGYAARTLRRAPTHLVVCVLTLGLALGCMAAVLSVIKPLLIEPLPYPDSRRVALVSERDALGGSSNTGFATFADLKRTLKSIKYAAAIGSWEPTLREGGEAERVVGERVSADYFRVLGVEPAIGRNFVAEEDVPNHPRVVMLSHRLWQRRFGGDSSVVGRTIDIEGTPHLVAGVMPSTYENVTNESAEIWRVLGYGPGQSFACRTCRHLRMIVRVRPDIPVTAADAEVDAALKNLASEYPRDYPAAGGNVTELRERVISGVKPILLAITGAVILVLLLAITNVAHLQLARTIRRGSEFAIRAALGAGRVQIARQLLSEAAIIAVLALVLSVAVAYSSTAFVVSQLPPMMPRLSAIRMDASVLAALAVLASLSTMIIGALPAWRLDSASLADALRAGQRGVAGGRQLARGMLVMSQVAIAFMLVTSAGLVGRSLLQLFNAPPGFAPDHLLTLQVQSTGARYRDNANVFAHHAAVASAVQALPGVVAVGYASQLPLSGNFDKYGVHAQDHPLDNPELGPSADRYVVSPGFLDAMRIRTIEGRTFTADDDRESSAKVVLVSASMAARLWPEGHPIGKRLHFGGDSAAPWREVVGVVSDVRHHGLQEEHAYQVYVPTRQWIFADDAVALVVRTSGDPSSMTNAVVDAVRRVDPTQPITNITTMDKLVVRSTGQRLLALALFGVFAVLSLILSGAGLYGMLAGMIAERTREIGIRTALGASRTNVVALVTRRASVLLIAGAGVGVAGSLLAGRFLESLLYGVTPADIPTLASAALLAVMMGVVASLVPTMRAVRIQPTVALTQV